MPHLLADPDQSGPRGVWTRLEDVLVDDLHPRRPVVAAWAEEVWIATVDWDLSEPGLVWMQPISEPIELPDPTAAHGCDRWATNVARQISQRSGQHGNARELEAVVAELLDARIDALLADFEATVALVADQVRRDRRIARAALADLASLPGPARRLALDLPGIRALHRLARRPRR